VTTSRFNRGMTMAGQLLFKGTSITSKRKAAAAFYLRKRNALVLEE
jgi:hypothetical protein